RQPGERLVRAEMKTGKHPSQLRPSEPSVGEIVDESLLVPINKSILQDRKKRPAGDQGDHNERQSSGPPLYGLRRCLCFRCEISGLGCQYLRNYGSFVSSLTGIAYNSMQEAIQDL